MTYAKDAFYNFAPVDSSSKTANGKELRILGRDSLDLRVISSGESTIVALRDVLYSPDIAYHLFPYDLLLYVVIRARVRGM